MRVDEPAWLLLGTASIVADAVRRALARRSAAVAESVAARGEELRRRSRAAASRYLTDLVDRVAASGPVSRVIDIQLTRVLEPLVDRAVPIVLDRLGERSAQVRLIVREHGEDLTGELVAGIRDRAAAADDVIERTARRLVGHRRDRPGGQP
jgi:hypothetical protein